jgi:hypothetical protein
MSGNDDGFNYGGKCQISWNNKIVIYKKKKHKQKNPRTPHFGQAK